MKKDKRRIPKGYYCYSGYGTTKRICPYWSIRRGKPRQANGYCAYLEKGDWDLNKEYHKRGRWKDGKTGKFIESPKRLLPLSLLWDQVKACDIKTEMTNEDKGACMQL